MKYLKVWTDLRNNLKPFGDAEKGRLFDAMMEYAEDGTEPDLRGNERFIWETIRSEIDRQREAYEKKCEVNRANITSRYEQLRKATTGNDWKQEHKTEDKDKEKEKERKKKFKPPTAGEVEEYCRERDNGIDAEAFVDFYASKGWMIGKNPMKDWKAAVRTWEQKRKQERVVDDSEARRKAEMDAWIRGEID